MSSARPPTAISEISQCDVSSRRRRSRGRSPTPPLTRHRPPSGTSTAAASASPRSITSSASTWAVSATPKSSERRSSRVANGRAHRVDGVVVGAASRPFAGVKPGCWARGSRERPRPMARDARECGRAVPGPSSRGGGRGSLGGGGRRCGRSWSAGAGEAGADVAGAGIAGPRLLPVHRRRARPGGRRPGRNGRRWAARTAPRSACAQPAAGAAGDAGGGGAGRGPRRSRRQRGGRACRPGGLDDRTEQVAVLVSARTRRRPRPRAAEPAPGVSPAAPRPKAVVNPAARSPRAAAGWW